MTAPRYQILVARTVTGEVVDALDEAGWTAEDNLGWADGAKVDITYPLLGRDRLGPLIRSSLRGIANGMSSLSLAVVRDGVALVAGPVMTMGWNEASVSIGASSISKLFDRRMIMNPDFLLDPVNPMADLVLDAIGRDLVRELLITATTGSRRGLPLTFPDADGTTGTPTIYRGLDLRTAYEAVKTLVETDGGPDVHLEPVLSTDQSALSWSVAIGTPALGELNPDATWDYPVIAINGDRDDSETTETGYLPGDSQGTDGARVIGVASVVRGEDDPALERADRTSVSETNKDKLDALARSYRDFYGQAAEEIGLGVPTDAGPQYRTQYNLGDIGSFSVVGHPWLDDVTFLRRIIGARLNPSTTVPVTVAA